MRYSWGIKFLVEKASWGPRGKSVSSWGPHEEVGQFPREKQFLMRKLMRNWNPHGETYEERKFLTKILMRNSVFHEELMRKLMCNSWGKNSSWLFFCKGLYLSISPSLPLPTYLSLSLSSFLLAFLSLLGVKPIDEKPFYINPSSHLCWRFHPLTAKRLLPSLRFIPYSFMSEVEWGKDKTWKRGPTTTRSYRWASKDLARKSILNQRQRRARSLGDQLTQTLTPQACWENFSVERWILETLVYWAANAFSWMIAVLSQSHCLSLYLTAL